MCVFDVEIVRIGPVNVISLKRVLWKPNEEINKMIEETEE